MTTPEFTSKVAGMHSTLELFTHRFTTDKDESLDLVQDTSLKALTYKDRFKSDVNLKGWLFTIMRNTFINNYRKTRREKTSKDNTKELYYLNVEDTYTSHSPESNYEYEDVWKNVHEIRQELVTPFKMLLSGYKYHEIARHLQIPIGTVKNRIFNARKEIQKKLSGYQEWN
jgi:RNA polymerase sigma-70 factor (ECF subfamily)